MADFLSVPCSQNKFPIFVELKPLVPVPGEREMKPPIRNGIEMNFPFCCLC